MGKRCAVLFDTLASPALPLFFVLFLVMRLAALPLFLLHSIVLFGSLRLHALTSASVLPQAYPAALDNVDLQRLE